MHLIFMLHREGRESKFPSHVTSDPSFCWVIAVCHRVLILTSVRFGGIVFCMKQVLISLE